MTAITKHAHRWAIGSATVRPGVYVGKCKDCGETREFAPYEHEERAHRDYEGVRELKRQRATKASKRARSGIALGEREVSVY